jgi:hypothetical protein
MLAPRVIVHAAEDVLDLPWLTFLRVYQVVAGAAVYRVVALIARQAAVDIVVVGTQVAYYPVIGAFAAVHVVAASVAVQEVVNGDVAVPAFATKYPVVAAVPFGAVAACKAPDEVRTNPSSAFHLQERDEPRQVGCALPTSKRPEPGRPEVRVYKKLGAVQMDNWTVYRVTGEALERLATTDKVAGRCIKHKR